MLLCDRCKDPKKVSVQKIRIFSLVTFEHNNFELPDKLPKKDNWNIDLCGQCQKILESTLQTAIYTIRTHQRFCS